uniref:Solute carrier family 26 member 11 n=1 Tax=Aquila chrysaetos chrysaetos TaxID=223781 RepID=A0A663EH64_AQUCH
MAAPGPRQRGQSCPCPGLRTRLPVLRWLPRYSLAWLQLDLIAGLTVGLTVVPQALAYAEVAGLPLQYGLYSSFMGCFVYCFLGTAKDVTLGPTAIMSLLVSSYAFHEPVYAILLAFLSGCIQLAMGLLHLGFLLDFISSPVIKGFTSAASITISFNQVKNILGLQGIPRQFFLQVYETLRRIGETRAGDAVLGLACLAALAGLRVMKSRLPRAAPAEPLAVRASYLIVWTSATACNALVVLFAGLVAYSFQVMGSQPLTLTGSIPQGLPAFRLPRFSVAAPNGTVPFWSMVEDMGVGLAVVPLMGLLETVAIAKAFASQNDYRIDPNQELLAMGFANILGSFVSSYPITGSFGRTAVNAQSGVCTPAGGLVTGTLVLLSLAYLTSLFYYIPKAALAAVIISAVVPMFDAGIFRTLWRVKRLDLVPLCVTFLLCFWEVQYGIVAGVLVSGILLLYSIARPPIKHLHHAPSSWTVATSAALITQWWWGWQSCSRSCASTASRWPSAACRYVGCSLGWPCAGSCCLSPCQASALLPRGESAPMGSALAAGICHKDAIASSGSSFIISSAFIISSTVISKRWRLQHLSPAVGCGTAGKGCILCPGLAGGLTALERWEGASSRLPQLSFLCPQDPVLQVLLSADLEGFQHFPSWEEAERCGGAEPGGSGAAPFASTSESSLLPAGLIQ